MLSLLGGRSCPLLIELALRILALARLCGMLMVEGYRRGTGCDWFCVLSNSTKHQNLSQSQGLVEQHCIFIPGVELYVLGMLSLIR